MIAVIIQMRLLAISHHVMEVNLDVPMLSVYQQIFTVTDIMIVRMKVMRPIVQLLHVPTINFCAPMEAQIKHQSVLQNHSCVMEKKIAMMAQTRKLLAQHLHVQL
jgi:uncharacterized membrane protein YvlD (DUF360 family)